MLDASMLAFLLPPFVASLILTGIHAYLGVHVVERGVIFVDLSLAQIAALGGTIAILLPVSGGDPHAPVVYWISLAFTFLGAFIFSMIRVKRARIPQEAIIGICYAVASAAAILAMSKATSESEHLKDMLVGNILAVSWAEVAKTAGLYGAIGLFHYIFRHQFLAISLDHSRTHTHGRSVRFWDFLFYASFGFVVTSSVAIAGVLLVFCYLIVPSVAAMLYAESVGRRLAIGWTMGTVVSALGVYASLMMDLPTDDRLHVRRRVDYHGARAADRAGRAAPDRRRSRPMKCRNCGAEIADKALICYRCGTATTEAKYQPAPLARGGSRSGLVATVIALALIAVLFVVMGRVAVGETSQYVRYAAVALAVVIVALRAYARRRR